MDSDINQLNSDMEDIVQEAQNADDKAKKAIADVILHLYSKFMLNTCKDHCGKHPNPCLLLITSILNGCESVDIAMSQSDPVSLHHWKMNLDIRKSNSA